MPVCTPKRIFNAESLELWAERVSKGWHKLFSKQELSLGEEIFRNGEIRELEVNEYDAIVHARFDQEECYSWVEWSKGGFSVRGSSKDKYLGRSLAAAGLYEIEQLLTDESEQLSPEKRQAIDVLKTNTENPFAQDNTQEDTDARPLVLDFSIKGKGVAFKAMWKESEDKFTLALKSENYTPGETNGTEREKLISLASSARKSGFRFNSKGGFYALVDMEKVRAFFENEVDGWKKKFALKLQDGLERIKDGIQDVELSVDFEACGEGTLDFTWDMSLDDEPLSADQARELIRNTEKPVLLPHFGLVTLTKEKLELLATWRRWLNLYPEQKIPRYALFSLFGEEPIQVHLSKELSDWRKSLFEKQSKIDNKLPDFLRPYQALGVKWLWHLCDKNCHALLADEMGLGKTIQILSLLSSRNIYPDKPNLIVCPASVVPVWQKEVQRFFPHIQVDIVKSGNDFYKSSGDTLWIASYAQLRMHEFLLNVTDFGYVVLDEAQHIKNPEAKVSKACMNIKAKHRIVLSGTPLENRYLDLWTLFRFLMPGLLGMRKQFEEHASNPEHNFGQKLKKQIAPFVLRRTKDSVLEELPGKTEIECICPLTDLQKKEYDRLTREGVKQLGEDIPTAVREKSLSFLTLLTRLRQASCDPGLLPWMDPSVEHSGKISVLVDKLEEILASNHKVVIFSQFVSLLDRIAIALRGTFPEIPVYQLTGKTVDRARPVDEFQAIDGPGVILVSLRAGGTGITLHSADYLFIMDPWWNPAVEEQAIDRVHRIGQDKPVFVYRMITSGTIESRIQSLKSEKKGIFSGVMGGMTDVSDMQNYFKSLSELIALLPNDR